MSDAGDPTVSGVGDAAEDVFVLPASYAQQRLWFIDQLEPGRATYNVPLNLRLGGTLDVRALERALSYLVERHEALRTVFDAPEGEPMQVILPPAPVPLLVTDLSEIAQGERNAAAARLIMEEGSTPFDLRTGPVFRASLIRLAHDEHVLLLTIHHIAVDGWSVGIIQRELRAAYTAFVAGTEPQLPELPIQYADYAAWQREHLESGAEDQQLSYWKTTLAAPLPTLDLPTDKPRLIERERTGGQTSVEIPPEVGARVNALARAAGTTPFTVLLAVFQLLLQRLTGQDDIVVGTPVAGRTRTETEGVVGFFVNTLAMRTNLDGAGSFNALLARARTTVHGALANQDLPFERLVEAVQPGRDRARNPIFQALFSVQTLAAGGTSTPMGSLQVSRAGSTRERAKFDLQLILSEYGAGYRGTLEFDADLFEQDTADRWGKRFVTLARVVTADPEAATQAISLLDDDERHLLTEVWNATAAEYPDQATVHDLVAAQIARTPQAVAARHGERELTYAELDQRATALALKLRTYGVGPDERVAICMERSLEMVVSVLAVLRAGGAYVPVDPSYPPQRVGYMLDAARVKVILTSARVAERLPDYKVPLLVVAADSKFFSDTAALSPGGAGPDNLAYVIYTSGSTGQPKGVAMPHRPLVNLLTWQARTSPATIGTPTLQFSSLSFDVSFQEIFSTWSTGGTLVLINDDERRDPERLFAHVVRERVQRIFMPYIALQHLADVAVRAEDPSALREIITAGEQLRVTPSIRAWLSQLPGCTLVNQYGPTESHVITALTLTGSPALWPELPSIGRPIANSACYVLEPNGSLAPVGVSGELFLAGTALARGYLHAPDRTAERFVPDPFSREASARMYRTGDLARWRGDGIIEYIGRTDGQVKIRGHRVELGEVEVALAQSADVSACVVIAREEPSGPAAGERRLVAYVVAAEGHEHSAARLRSFLKERLPEYMVPTAFVAMDRLPLTPSGKIDRRSLPEPTDLAEAGEAGSDYVPPRTTLEHELVHIWESLLSQRPIGIRDDFFELGGHSLLAVRMLHEIEQVRGRRLPLAALFDNSTIEGIAYLLETAVRDEGEPPVVVLQGEGRARPFAFVHGDIRGGGYYCRRLAPMLGEEIPLIVFPTIRPDAPGNPITIEEMAAVHVAELRRVQPQGPYRIGGYCHGGQVALEMARQLALSGERVERLILVDTSVPNARFRAAEPFLGLATVGHGRTERLERRGNIYKRIRYFSGRIRAVRRMPVGDRLRWLSTNVSRRIPGLGADTTPSAAPVDARDVAFKTRPGSAHLQFVTRAQEGYSPGPYPGDVELIWAGRMGGNPLAAWRRVARNVHIHVVDSTHVGVITYDLPNVAAKIAECLRG